MFKEKLIEIIPKAKKTISPVVNYLFWLSFVLVAILVGLFFFLQNQISLLEQKKENLEKNLTAISKEGELGKEINLTAERIDIFSKILKEHKITSNFFKFLKDYCHTKVRFLSLDLDAKILRATLKGKTDDFQALGEQILILKESGLTDDVQVSEISLDKKGKIGFGLSFNFSPDLVR